MKLLASGDHHYDEDSPRWRECLYVHNHMVDVARDEKVDLFVSTGDVYERASTPLEREAVAEWLTRMTDVCPVLVVKGNHDKHRDCELMARLRTRHPIIIEERAGVHRIAGVAVAAMAWPERSYLMATHGDSAATSDALHDATRGVLRGLGQQLAEFDGPRILASHCMVDGSVTSSGQPLIGMPINVGLTDLALAGAHLGLFGHVHKEQRFDVNGAPHLYTGSPYRTDFGQLERKSIWIAEFYGKQLCEVKQIDTPCAAMFHMEYEWDSTNGLLLVDGHQVTEADWPWLANAEVRLRYHVEANHREAAERAANETADCMRKLGAVLVNVEERVRVTHRSRAPEVAAATGIVNKLSAHWCSIGFDPGERRNSILEKASRLEAQARES